MDSPERTSSKMRPKYVTLKYCFFNVNNVNGFEFLILYLLQNRIDFVLSSPK